MYPSLKLYVHHYFIYGFGGKATSHSKFLTCSKNQKGSLKLLKKKKNSSPKTRAQQVI